MGKFLQICRAASIPHWPKWTAGGPWLHLVAEDPGLKLVAEAPWFQLQIVTVGPRLPLFPLHPIVMR